MNPSFDDNLKELYDRLQEIKTKMETSHDKLSRYIGLEKKNIKLELSNQHGYCFRVTMKDEKVLRKKSGIFQVDSSKAGVRFRNNELEQLNKDYTRINDEYLKQQQYVVSEILICAEGKFKYLLFKVILCVNNGSKLSSLIVIFAFRLFPLLDRAWFSLFQA